MKERRLGKRLSVAPEHNQTRSSDDLGNPLLQNFDALLDGQKGRMITSTPSRSVDHMLTLNLITAWQAPYEKQRLIYI